MRIFFAINLPDEVKNKLEPLIEEARQKNKSTGLRWIKTKSLHLTLHFLGEQNKDAVDLLANIGQKAANDLNPAEAVIDEWGAFPNLTAPRIIYLKMKELPMIKELYQSLSGLLQENGFKTDSRPFRSHITVARNKFTQKVTPSLPKFEPLSWQVDSFELMKSNLLPDGAEYEVLESFPLSEMP